MTVDLYFTYRNNLRLFMINKFIYRNLYEIADINFSYFHFSIKEYENLDNKEIYNFFYLFKFFFGKLAFFSSYKNQFILGKWYHSFDVKIIVKKRMYFYYLFFLFNDLLFNLSRDCYDIVYDGSSYCITVLDMNIFNNKKSNLGLFNLKNSLKFVFYLTKKSIAYNKFFFDFLKIK